MKMMKLRWGLIFWFFSSKNVLYLSKLENLRDLWNSYYNNIPTMQETQYDKKYSDLFQFRKSVMIFVAKVKIFLYTFLQIKRPLCAKGNFFYIWPRTYILHTHLQSESKKKITIKILIQNHLNILNTQIIFIEFKKILKAIVI